MKLQAPTTGRLTTGMITERIFRMKSTLSTTVCETFSFSTRLTFVGPYLSYGPPRSNKDLRNLPLIRPNHPHNLRLDILKSAGLKPGEINPGKRLELRGALSDIDARTLYNGPFRLELTDDPSEHLRFDESGSRHQPTIFVLDSSTILTLALLDLTGFME